MRGAATGKGEINTKACACGLGVGGGLREGEKGKPTEGGKRRGK